MRDHVRVGVLRTALQAEAVERLLAGTSVDLHGLPGSGRSSLLRSIGEELADGGYRTRQVRGVAALRDRALEPLAIAGLAGPRQAPGARQTAATQAGTTAVAAATRAVVDAVSDGQTVLVVDDADDLDQTSVGVLAAAHAERGFPLLSTSVPRPRTAPQVSLSTQVRPTVVLDVPGLTYLGTQALLADLLGSTVDAVVVSRIFTASGGLPGVVRAVVDGAVRAGALVRTDGVWSPGADLWTPDLHHGLEPLLVHLTPRALDGLHLLSLAGATSLSAARTLVGWGVLEELDGYRLLRFVPRGDDLLVGVHPPLLAERFHRLGTDAHHLRLQERLARLPGRMRTAVPHPTALPAPPDQDAPVRRVATEVATPDVAVDSRLIAEHWFRRTQTSRDQWQADPSPATAVPYLHALLVGNADGDTLRAVIDGTPRTGDRGAVVQLDVWSALAVTVADRDLDRARAILDRARSDDAGHASLLDAVATHITLLVDRAADPLDQPLPAPGTDPTTAWAMTAVRAELLVAHGRPAEALELLEGLEPEDLALSRSSSEGPDNGVPEVGPDHEPSTVRAAAYGLALLLDARYDEALRWSTAQIDQARARDDIDAVLAHSGTAAIVLRLQLRLAELRALLALPLAVGMHSALQRPAELALLSIGASLALEDGQPAVTRDLVEQARQLRFGPSWYPLASSTLPLAVLDTVGLPPSQARQTRADRLWGEFDDLRARDLRASALWVGTLAVAEQAVPSGQQDAGRVASLLDLARRLPAGSARHAELFVEALCADDPEQTLTAADVLAGCGAVYLAVRAYAHGLHTLHATAAPGRAAEAREDARARLAPYGPDAVAALNQIVAPTLTEREREVARLAAEGLANQAIAERLTISVRTVENHLHHVFQKTGVDNRAGLASALPG